MSIIPKFIKYDLAKIEYFKLSGDDDHSASTGSESLVFTTRLHHPPFVRRLRGVNRLRQKAHVGYVARRRAVDKHRRAVYTVLHLNAARVLGSARCANRLFRI